MLKFIIRLDDACPNMNEENWIKIENLLNKYNIKPIVGIIPDTQDESFLKYGTIDDFWNKYALKWKKGGWIIAQHGLHHKLSTTVRTEFKGKTYNEQKDIIEMGYNLLVNKNIQPKCFFAPAHTFDDTTIKVCKDLDYFEFISDGYAFYPYREQGVLFIPSVFDTPHVISKNGIYTFVYHPNNMSDSQFEYLEKFIDQYNENFKVDINTIISEFKNRKRNFKDNILKISIKTYRFLRKIVKGKQNA